MKDIQLRAHPATTIKHPQRSQIKGSKFLHFFNRSLMGYKILLHHSPSQTWFFGLVLLETKNMLEVIGWRLLETRLMVQTPSLPSQLKKCLKKLYQIPIQTFLDGLSSLEKNTSQNQNLRERVPIECHPFISSDANLSCKKFPKEAITIFWSTCQKMSKRLTNLVKMNDCDEIFIRIEGRKLIGRPWERLIKEPRKRW